MTAAERRAVPIVHLVGAGPGDPGLLTVRGREVLAEADVVVHDRLVDPAVLALARRGARLVDVGKRPGSPPEAEAARQDHINELLVREARAGRRVVRLKGGDPFVFGRGGEEVEALDRAGVPCRVVPGVSSAFAVPAAAGIPVTYRGLASSVTVVTGRPGQRKERNERKGRKKGTDGVDWPALARTSGTIVVLMGVAAREEIAEGLIEGGRPGDTPVAVIQWGTTAAQRVERTDLDGLAKVTIGSPAIVVVGPVAALGLGPGSGTSPSAPLPLAGRNVIVTRSADRSADLRRALAELGATVVTMPLTEVAPPADGGAALRRAVSELPRFTWVVLTSVNAVEAFVGAVTAGADLRALAGLRLAAVGPATAAALAAHGLRADLVPERHSAAGLVAEFPVSEPARGSPAPPTVLFPAAAGARPELRAGLRERGWVVEQVEAYATVAASPPPAALADAARRADVAVFAAPSAVSAWSNFLDDEGRPLGAPARAVCIGESTGEEARRRGFPMTAVAPGTTPAALAAAVVEAAHPANLEGPRTGRDSGDE